MTIEKNNKLNNPKKSSSENRELNLKVDKILKGDSIYFEILKDLEVLEDFDGKVSKKIYFFRHPEADKSIENGKLTEKGKKDLENKVEILKNYGKNLKILIRAALYGKNGEEIYRISETVKYLNENLKDNVIGIIEEKALDTREKVEYKGNDDILSKNEALKQQEQETFRFYKEFFNRVNNEKGYLEIHVIHSTNMDVIYRIINQEYHPEKTGYNFLKMGESFEIDILTDGKILNNNLLFKIDFSNYEDIILEFGKSNFIPEKIKEAIMYFNAGQISIIDFQNVVNKNIIKDPNFIMNFKDSDNLYLRKLAFLHILKGENLLDDEIENLILSNKLGEKINELVEVFYEVINYQVDENFLESIIYGYKNYKEDLEKIFKIIAVLDSSKIFDLNINNKLFKIYQFFQNNGFIDFGIYDKKIQNSILFLGFSNILKENLSLFKKVFDVDVNISNQNFIFRVYLSDKEKLDIYMYYSQNGEYKTHKVQLLERRIYENKLNNGELNIEEEFKRIFGIIGLKENKNLSIEGKKQKILSSFGAIGEVIDEKMYFKFIDYINKNYNFKRANYDYDFGKNLIFNFVFENGRLVLEREELLSSFFGKLNHKNLSVLSECENFLKESFNKGEISNDFLNFIDKNKDFIYDYLYGKIKDILFEIKFSIFSLFRKYNKSEDLQKLVMVDFYGVSDLSLEKINLEKAKKELLEIKIDFFKKSKILKIFFSKINKNLNHNDIGYQIMLREYRELNEFFEKIK